MSEERTIVECKPGDLVYAKANEENGKMCGSTMTAVLGGRNGTILAYIFKKSEYNKCWCCGIQFPIGTNLRIIDVHPNEIYKKLTVDDFRKLDEKERAWVMEMQAKFHDKEIKRLKEENAKLREEIACMERNWPCPENCFNFDECGETCKSYGICEDFAVKEQSE